VRAARTVVRAAEDLHDLADRARRDPDPVEEVRERIDALLALLTEVVAEAGRVNATAAVLDVRAAELVDGGEDLLRETQALQFTARELVTGGRDLKETGDTLDGHTVELITGGQDLTAVAEQLSATLSVFRLALPRLLQGLDTVDELETAVETVAETVEPLQGAAERVGRVTKRLSRTG
jgi:prefoldin subunit 5